MLSTQRPRIHNLMMIAIEKLKRNTNTNQTQCEGKKQTNQLKDLCCIFEILTPQDISLYDGGYITSHWLPCSSNQINRAACMIVSGSCRISLDLDLKYDHHHFEDDDHHSASVVVDIFMTRSCWLPRVRGRL